MTIQTPGFYTPWVESQKRYLINNLKAKKQIILNFTKRQPQQLQLPPQQPINYTTIKNT